MGKFQRDAVIFGGTRSLRPPGFGGPDEKFSEDLSLEQDSEI
jgi:hypothetical protein